MLSFECIKNEKSVYFLLTSAFEDKNQEISQAGEVLSGRVKRNVSICPTAVLVVNIVVFYKSIYYNLNKCTPHSCYFSDELGVQFF